MSTQQANITKLPADERGTADHGWLQARFSFSFGGYFNPDRMGFHALRVINNDTVQPGGGFATHPHDNMEIFTYVIEGALAHKDSMGNGATITPGNLQYMSAASGVTHSEFNPSDQEHTLLYQIWLTPNERDGEPRYAEKPLGDQATPNALTLLFSGDGRDGSTPIRQDAEIFFGRLDAGNELTVEADSDHPHVWIQVIKGHIESLKEDLRSGDGCSAEDHPAAFPIRAQEESEFLLFRLS
jgi:redox-sensitive bicupin YhaK (pirin superfamily)